jgi:hypothetical protein
MLKLWSPNYPRPSGNSESNPQRKQGRPRLRVGLVRLASVHAYWLEFLDGLNYPKSGRVRRPGRSAYI